MCDILEGNGNEAYFKKRMNGSWKGMNNVRWHLHPKRMVCMRCCWMTREMQKKKKKKRNKLSLVDIGPVCVALLCWRWFVPSHRLYRTRWTMTRRRDFDIHDRDWMERCHASSLMSFSMWVSHHWHSCRCQQHCRTVNFAIQQKRRSV